MSWIAWAVWIFLFVSLGGLFLAILRAQKKLDAPMRGFLLVDKQDEEGPTMVYLQALVDPGTFTDGEEVKLKVRIVPPESQGKQGSE